MDDLHARAGVEKKNMVQIHGDIFVTRCARCEWRAEFCDADRMGTGLAGARPSIAGNEQEQAEDGLQDCPECHALMRPGVVWFGEQLSQNELERVEDFLDGGTCDVVIVAGTTATFGYIIDWALRGSRDGGEVGRAIRCPPFREDRRAQECAPYQLIEVNPEETPLSRFATRLVREPAAIALPRIVDELIAFG